MGSHAKRLVLANAAAWPELHHRTHSFVVCHFWYDTTTLSVVKAATSTVLPGVSPGHSGLPAVHRGKGLVDCTGSRSGVDRGKGHVHNLGRPLKTGCTPVLRALHAVYSVSRSCIGIVTSSDPSDAEEALLGGAMEDGGTVSAPSPREPPTALVLVDEDEAAAAGRNGGTGCAPFPGRLPHMVVVLKVGNSSSTCSKAGSAHAASRFMTTRIHSATVLLVASDGISPIAKDVPRQSQQACSQHLHPGSCPSV